MENLEDEFHEKMVTAIRSAEVMSVFFVRVGRSLIFDLRRDGLTGPAVMVDDIVSTPQARLQSFRRLRPGLPLPDRLTLAPWSVGIREFRDLGLLDAVLERCEAEGGSELRSAAARAFRELVILEQKYLRDLVRGVGMETIWQRSDP